MLGCRIVGHSARFSAAGSTMSWHCDRCGAELGTKTYASEASARRYAQAFDRRDSDDLGRRAPLLGMLPLRLWRRLKERVERPG